MAAERAPTIATAIQNSCHADGKPRAASTAPNKAKGSAKSVCSILIISSVVRTLCVVLLMLAAIRCVARRPLSHVPRAERITIKQTRGRRKTASRGGVSAAVDLQVASRAAHTWHSAKNLREANRL